LQGADEGYHTLVVTVPIDHHDCHLADRQAVNVGEVREVQPIAVHFKAQISALFPEVEIYSLNRPAKVEIDIDVVGVELVARSSGPSDEKFRERPDRLSIHPLIHSDASILSQGASDGC
jgi:hypothetical protein